MQVITTLTDLRHALDAMRRPGASLGLVPTMGALHAGHAALIRQAAAECDTVLTTVFVNPTQFGPHEDLARYPRTPEADTALAEEAGSELLWFPAVETLYPTGEKTRVRVAEIETILEGACRPGHFEGVATVVTKLLLATRPDHLYLGEKDYQQTVVLRRMVADLLFPVTIVVVPTVRDPDGLALSSRNRFLSPPERAAALAIPRALDAAASQVAGGERRANRIGETMQAILADEPLLRVEYATVADPDTLAPIDRIDGSARALIAARVGTTRLIDNRGLHP